MQKNIHNRSSKRTLITAIVSIIIIIAIFIIAKTVLDRGVTPQTEYVPNDSKGSELDSRALSDDENTLNMSTMDEIYVQHDGNSGDIYILTSQGDSTTVYQIIDVKLTAAKQWTESGLYVDAPENNCCATAPTGYINVTEGEIYFVRLFGLHEDYKGENGVVLSQVTPVLFKDDDGSFVERALGGT